MSEHDRFRELLVLRLADDLDAGDAIALDAHLAGCASCRDEAAALVPLAPPAFDSEAVEDDRAFQSWRSNVLARTVVPHRRRVALRRAAIAASIFLAGASVGIVGTLRANETKTPSDVARIQTHTAPAGAFATERPPPASVPSGPLALLSRARSR